MQNLLCTHSEPVGKTRLTNWVREYASRLGIRCANELARREKHEQAHEDFPKESRMQRPGGKWLRTLRGPCRWARAPCQPLAITLAGRAEPAVR